MALVTVQLNTDVPEEKAALTQLFGGGFVAAVQKTTASVTVPSEIPAPKAPAAPKAKPQPKPVEEPPAAEEDLLGGTDFAALRKQVVDKATEIVSKQGGPVKVRGILNDLGAARVSELADDQLEAFLAAIA